MYGVTSLSEHIANKMCGGSYEARISRVLSFVPITAGACAISVFANNIRGEDGKGGRAHGKWRRTVPRSVYIPSKRWQARDHCNQKARKQWRRKLGFAQCGWRFREIVSGSRGSTRAESGWKLKYVADQACGGNLYQAFLTFAVGREMGKTSPTGGRNNQPEKLGATWKKTIHMIEGVVRQAHYRSALMGATQIGHVDNGGIKTEKDSSAKSTGRADHRLCRWC